METDLALVTVLLINQQQTSIKKYVTTTAYNGRYFARITWSLAPQTFCWI